MTRENDLQRETEALTQLVELINAKGDTGEINAILEKGDQKEQDQ
jgi:hypothetical protein